MKGEKEAGQAGLWHQGDCALNKRVCINFPKTFLELRKTRNQNQDFFSFFEQWKVES